MRRNPERGVPRVLAARDVSSEVAPISSASRKSPLPDGSGDKPPGIDGNTLRRG